MTKNLLRKLPSVDVLMKTKEAQALIEKYSRDLVANAVRGVLTELRSEIRKAGVNSFPEAKLSSGNILKRVEKDLQETFSSSLNQGINATGVILHTGLGRAVLSEDAREAIHRASDGYCTLAIDIETGRRGHRDVHLEGLLCELTGAEAATVANNNAAATMLILNTLAQGREVIVSRGQLVEIGGAFRMPDVMEASGAILREVGTTNKTHLKDYVAAINENTGAIMRVHHSNYRIVGFAEEPSIEDLSKVAQEHNIPLIDDLGSGALLDLKEFGIETEPLVQDSVKAGVDVACFSGDKLIGGPQAGIIVGKELTLKRIKKNPLMRALRVGKLTIAGMEATLRLFLNLEKLKDKHPVYKMFSLTIDELEKRGQKIKKKIQAEISKEAELSLEDGGSQVGSGSVPVETIPTRLLKVQSASTSAENLAKKLRASNPP
ncbi:MAG: L-seryl-tRNA(Sec) selenium transferase, partial [Candidatus Aminicenantes bacterium]